MFIPSYTSLVLRLLKFIALLNRSADEQAGEDGVAVQEDET